MDGLKEHPRRDAVERREVASIITFSPRTVWIRSSIVARSLASGVTPAIVRADPRPTLSRFLGV